MPLIDITDDGDERVFIHLDGELLIEVNHDEHGWDGMLAVINAVKKIALAADIDFNDVQDIV